MQRSFPGADRLGSVDDRGTSESKGYLMHQGADGWIHRHQGVNGSESINFWRCRVNGCQRTESKSCDSNHLSPCQGGSSIEKRILNSLKTEMYNPLWRVSIFSAIPAISNQRLLEQLDHLLMISLTAVWGIH
jgi:hypothetical protein